MDVMIHIFNINLAYKSMNLNKMNLILNTIILVYLGVNHLIMKHHS